MSAMPAARVTELGSLAAAGGLGRQRQCEQHGALGGPEVGQRQPGQPHGCHQLERDVTLPGGVVDRLSRAPAEARPALCTTPSMRPQRDTAASANATRSCGTDTSGALRQHVGAGRQQARRPPPGAPRRGRRWRPTHPRRRAGWRDARPSPSLPPVTSTTLPASSSSIGHSPFVSVDVTPARKRSASACERRRTKRRCAHCGSFSASA